MCRRNKELKMLLVLIVTLTAFTPTETSAPTDSCIDSNSIRKNGEIFGLPGNKCVRFKCNKGVKETIQEGCESRGKCYNVDSTFQLYCRTYKCTKTVTDGDAGYKTIVVETMCMTTDNKCHKVGGETFSYKKKSKTYDNCTCKQGAGSDVTIDCER